MKFSSGFRVLGMAVIMGTHGIRNKGCRLRNTVFLETEGDFNRIVFMC